jgi:hypothetical protein
MLFLAPNINVKKHKINTNLDTPNGNGTEKANAHMLKSTVLFNLASISQY